MRTFVFTPGDINGIGPEIVFKTLNIIKDSGNRFILIIPENVFDNTSDLIKPLFEHEMLKGEKLSWKRQVQLVMIRKTSVNPGEATKQSGKKSFEAVQIAFRLLKRSRANAVITAPISKYALKLAGISYPGHTEMFADWCKVKNYLMMFLSDDFKAALNSIHIPIKEVSKKMNRKILIKNLNTAIITLKNDLKLRYPRIAVLGLNPHAGEDGIIGKEEERVLIPLINEFRECEGPFSPDAFFAAKLYKKYDLTFGMYHDQVLIPFKLINFNKGVNYTAGLPIIRTSPDHGTAFDIAGKGIADESSMIEAYRYAEIIAKNRNS